MNIDELVTRIIPPDDYQHRNGFNNTDIIDKLNSQEKRAVENVLISRLSDKTDLLIVETLAYIKSEKALPVLYALLKENIGETATIVVAEAIFSINQDSKMVGIAIKAFRELEGIKDAYFVYRLLPVFYHLRKFRDDAADSIIREYSTHSNYLLSYNAKQALSR